MAAPKIIKTKAEPHGTFPAPEQKLRAWMQVIISLVLLVAGILILTSPNFIFPNALDEGTKRFAAGWIGAIVGYWLS